MHKTRGLLVYSRHNDNRHKTSTPSDESRMVTSHLLNPKSDRHSTGHRRERIVKGDPNGDLRKPSDFTEGTFHLFRGRCWRLNSYPLLLCTRGLQDGVVLVSENPRQPCPRLPLPTCVLPASYLFPFQSQFPLFQSSVCSHPYLRAHRLSLYLWAPSVRHQVVVPFVYDRFPFLLFFLPLPFEST